MLGLVGAASGVRCQPVHNEQGFTLIELLIVVAIIGLLAAIAAPGLLRARMTANETSAIGSLRAISTAETSYSAACGHGSYATLFATLARGPGGSGDGFLSPDLATTPVPNKNGYIFTLAPGAGGIPNGPDCNGVLTTTAYYMSATPIAIGASGSRGFAANQSFAIWQDLSGAPPGEPFTSGAGVSPVR